MIHGEQQESGNLRPMPLGEALLFFGIPAVVTLFCVYSLFPYLVEQGFSSYISYVIALDIPLALMFASSLVGYRMEGKSAKLAGIA